MTSLQLHRMAELWAGSMPVKEIANRMGLSPNMVVWTAYKHRDMFPSRKWRGTQDERDQWADLYLSGELTAKECASRAGCTAEAVRKWARARRAEP